MKHILRSAGLAAGLFGALGLAHAAAPVAPAKAASAPAHATTARGPAGVVSKAPVAKRKPRVDINNADRKQLKGLYGVGDAEADRIIAGRPYLSKADLVTKQILPEGAFVAIRRQIVVGKPAGGTRGAKSAS